MKILIGFLFLFVLPYSLYPQKDCALKLREAQDVFNAGQIERIPDLLADCIQSGFTREEKLLAYKLLINASILDDNATVADNYMLEFLKNFPEYKPTSADPLVFVNLMEEFDNRPRFNIGITGGTNISDIRVIEYYGVHNLNAVKGNYSAGGFGYQAGIHVSKMLNERFDLGFEPMFMQFRYHFEVKPFPFAKVQFSETQNNLVLPLSVSMLLSSRNFIPYIKAGVAARILLSATGTADRNYDNTANIIFSDIKGPVSDISARREQFNYLARLGFGVKYRIPTGYFFLDAGYHYSFLNDVAPESRSMASDDLSLLYYYTDNDFRANFITLSLGFSYSFYKPRKPER